ncbi:MAG: dTDP-4-dehydrorhamnose 3,5-epimerase [Candidatus Kapabacteria bacterium]|nr:dTDP-4-dehydrorhamnose 3,5-epimerase [Candidatus Kapabacteria bacterium]
MGLKVKERYLNGIILFEQSVFGDERGFFLEAFRADEFEMLGLPTQFLQDNHSRSQKGVLRGMHFQWDKPMGKLIRVTRGAALVAEIDIRHNSPTLAEHIKVELNEENKYQLWVPAGFANGFLSLSDIVEVQYKCTSIWNPKAESNILWNDKRVGIEWGMENPSLSDKDKVAQTLDEWLASPNSKEFSI